MAKDLHKGIALDDKFAVQIGRVQQALQKLEELAAQFYSAGHKPTEAQLRQLEVAGTWATSLSKIFDEE